MQIWQKFLEFLKSQQAIHFFSDKLSFIDFAIIGLGIFLLISQILKRLATFNNSFYRKAQDNPLYLVRTEIKLEYTANLIEILPMLGLFGTVWGLMNALVIIAESQSPTIKDIAINIAPAISTTFLGLLFAIINLWIFNLNRAYFEELITWCRQHISTNSIAKP